MVIPPLKHCLSLIFTPTTQDSHRSNTTFLEFPADEKFCYSNGQLRRISPNLPTFATHGRVSQWSHSHNFFDHIPDIFLSNCGQSLMIFGHILVIASVCKRRGSKIFLFKIYSLHTVIVDKIIKFCYTYPTTFFIVNVSPNE